MKPRFYGHAVIVLAFLALTVTAARAGDETCWPIPADQWAPAGTAGCTLDGPTDGVASTWGGKVAAAQWCVFPWTDCTPIRVQSHVTGIVIEVTPAQFCHCWWMTDRRLVDLTRGQVLALGLDPRDGLFEVAVTPIRAGIEPVLPDTRLAS